MYFADDSQQHVQPGVLKKFRIGQQHTQRRLGDTSALQHNQGRHQAKAHLKKSGAKKNADTLTRAAFQARPD